LKIVLIEGLTSLDGRRKIREVVGRIEAEVQTPIQIIEYVEFVEHSVKKLKKSSGIEEYAKEIIKNFNPNESLILIGYSMGGLVARWMVEKMGLEIKGLIFLAVPHRGINLSRREKVLLKLIGTVACVKDMKQGSAFLKSLGNPSSDECYYFFGATEDSRVALNSSLPIDNGRSVLVNAKHKDVADDQIIRKIADIIRLLEKT